MGTIFLIFKQSGYIDEFFNLLKKKKKKHVKTGASITLHYITYAEILPYSTDLFKFKLLKIEFICSGECSAKGWS